MALKASKSWNRMYEAWKDEGNRERYSPEERAALVRGCMGKPAIENLLDAFRMVKSLPPREDSNIHIYCCELCGFLHFGNLRPGKRDLIAVLLCNQGDCRGDEKGCSNSKCGRGTLSAS
jgi:hypothetical protein